MKAVQVPVAKALVIVSCVAIALTGCAKNLDPDAFTGCLSGSVPQNQMGSFERRIHTLPAQVFVDENFSTFDVDSIEQAIQKWNALGQELIHTDFFKFDRNTDMKSVPSDAIPQGPGECGSSPLPESAFYIVKADSAVVDWNQIGLSIFNPGATIRCWEDGKPVQQVMLLNTDLFSPDSTLTVAIHELGHAIGLKHSCDGSKNAQNSSDYLSCVDVTSSNPYSQAVMFPIMNHEFKENLALNDKQRAECLYGAK